MKIIFSLAFLMSMNAFAGTALHFSHSSDILTLSRLAGSDDIVISGTIDRTFKKTEENVDGSEWYQSENCVLLVETNQDGDAIQVSSYGGYLNCAIVYSAKEAMLPDGSYTVK